MAARRYMTGAAQGGTRPCSAGKLPPGQLPGPDLPRGLAGTAHPEK